MAARSAPAFSRRDFLRRGGSGAPTRSGAFLSARGREHDVASGFAADDQAAATAPGAIRLNSNENPVGPSKFALDAIVAALPESGRYPDPQKVTVPEQSLRDAIAASTGTASGNIVLGAGSGELLGAAVRAFTSPSKALVTAWPSFETPHTMAGKIGTPIKAIDPDKDMALDVPKMLAASNGAGLIFFCNPNNPTATVHGEATLKDFVANVHEASPSTVILIDEAYHDYVTDPSYKTMIPLAIATPNVIVMRTFSKAHGMAGVRLGYAIGQPATVRAISRYRNGLNTSVPGVAAAVASLKDTAHIERERARNTEVRAFTTKFFSDLGLKTTASQANFLYVDLARPTAPFRDACKTAGVLVGRDFPPTGNTYCRISIGTMDEMQRAVAVFKKILHT